MTMTLRRHGAVAFLVVSAAALVAAFLLGLIEVLAAVLSLAPLLGAWASWKLWKWHRFYGTRFLWGLFVASIAADLAAVPVAWLSVRRLWLGPDAPPFVGSGEILGLALMVFEGVFIYLVLRWSDLDLDMQRVRTGAEDETSGTNQPPKEGTL